MPRFSDMTNRWDQWALMRCPLLWQLRLHWYLPLALLWCVLVLGIWMQWMAEPARWMGSLPGVASTARQTPEQLARSEEHTSELQSPCNLVCRLLLEKKKTQT